MKPKPSQMIAIRPSRLKQQPSSVPADWVAAMADLRRYTISGAGKRANRKLPLCMAIEEGGSPCPNNAVAPNALYCEHHGRR